MLVFGAALLSVGASDSFSLTLLLFCMATAGHGAYHSTILMNPSDITPDHTGFMFGKFSCNTPHQPDLSPV